MTDYDRGFIAGMEQAKRVCSSYAFEHLQDVRKAERAVGANSVANVIRLQIEAAKRDDRGETQ